MPPRWQRALAQPFHEKITSPEVAIKSTAQDITQPETSDAGGSIPRRIIYKTMKGNDFYTYEETLRDTAVKRADNSVLKHSEHRLMYQLIQDIETLEQAIAPFLTTKRLAFDCETTGIDPHTDRIRLLQIAVPAQPVLVLDLFAFSVDECSLLQKLLASPMLKIAHNLKFDWQFLTQAGFQLSGPFFDTQLAYQVLKAGRKGKASLGVVAKKLLGIKLDKAQQQSDFSKPQLTAAQLTYAAMDAQVLLALHEALTVRLKHQKLLAIARLESDCVPATAQMELNGMQLQSRSLANSRHPIASAIAYGVANLSALFG